MDRSTTPPDEFIATLPDGVREDIATLDAEIATVMSAHERVLWEGVFWGGTQQRIIGYGSYRYKGRSGAEGEWFIVGLAAQKNYLSLYVNAAADGPPSRSSTRRGSARSRPAAATSSSNDSRTSIWR